jgi:hypothetical protein
MEVERTVERAWQTQKKAEVPSRILCQVGSRIAAKY